MAKKLSEAESGFRDVSGRLVDAERNLLMLSGAQQTLQNMMSTMSTDKTSGRSMLESRVIQSVRNVIQSLEREVQKRHGGNQS